MGDRFEGRAVMITGGGAGIGRAVALRMASEGAAVAVADIRPDRARAVAMEVEAAGRRALPLSGDVTCSADNERFVSETIEAFGSLHARDDAGMRVPATASPSRRTPSIRYSPRSQVGHPQQAARSALRAAGGGIVHLSSIFGCRGGSGAVFSAAGECGGPHAGDGSVTPPRASA
jgi:NAD(P)-dependent dehydrogenase (short-subunit alcohol dehydrogenase family)